MYNEGRSDPRPAIATLAIRNVDAVVKERLRVRAARHGRSMEAEAQSILSEAVAGDREKPEPNLAEAMRWRFAPLGGVDLELPPAELSTCLPRSIRYRCRHRCHLGADARRTAPSGAGVDGGATPHSALHDAHQSGRNPLWHHCPTRRPEAHRAGGNGNGNVRRGFSWPYSAVRSRSGGALPWGRARTSAGRQSDREI